MKSPATTDATQIWAPPAPSTGRTRKRWQRSLTIGAVIAIHIVGVVMFAARPLGFRKADDAAAQNVVYLADQLTAPSAEGAAVAPQSVADMLESDAARQPRGDFVPPRLKTPVPELAGYARRAGVRPDGPAHVVLAVKISELGVPAEVRVSSGSGNSRADELAIEFARNLRWNPATDKGAKTGAEIRLPVTLALTD